MRSVFLKLPLIFQEEFFLSDHVLVGVIALLYTYSKATILIPSGNKIVFMTNGQLEIRAFVSFQTHLHKLFLI